jgi:endonuclease/exonuclease/phosphatase family metal-dependent hydrolase
MRVLSWNIQWGRGCDGCVDLARIAAVARATAEADVMCFQEVAVNFEGLAGGRGEDEVALLAAAFPDFTPVYGIATDLPDGRGGRSLFGNLILARARVLQVFRHLLPWPADPAVPSMQRVCVEAVVETGLGPLRLMTTHLEYYSQPQRLAQAQALRALQREGHALACRPPANKDGSPSFAVAPRGLHTVLCGDFNCSPDTPEYRSLLADFDDGTPAFVDAWQVAHPGLPNADTVGLHECEWPDENYCCDYFFVSANLAPRVRELRVNQDTDASDHQPLVLTLDAA